MAFSHSMVFGPTFIPGAAGANRPIVFWDDFVTAWTVRDATGEIPMDQGGKFNDVADAGEWLVSGLNTGVPVPPSIADESGGVVSMTTGSAGASNRVGCQLNGQMFSLANGRELYFEMRAHVSTSADFAAGVMDENTSQSNFADGVTIGILGTSTLQVRVEKDSNGAVASTGTTIEDDAYSVYAFKCRADKKVEFYLNGVRVALVDGGANFPDDALLTPSFQINTNTVGVDETLKIDYILCVGER